MMVPLLARERGHLKWLAVALLLAAAPGAWVPMILSKAKVLVASGYPFLACFYAATAALCVVAFSGAPFIRFTVVRWLLVATYLLGFAVNHVAVAVQGQPFSVHLAATLLQKWQLYERVTGAYLRHIMVAGGLVTVTAPFLLCRPSGRHALGGWFLGVPAAAPLVAGLFVANLHGRVEEFPEPVVAPLQAYYGARETLVYSGPRDPVVYKGTLAAHEFEKIVVLLDEGIRGDYLEFNNPTLDNTPFLVSVAPRLANFGLAVSYANCSALSRVAFRSGARAGAFPDVNQRVLHEPTIWQFAKEAGYRTVNIDAWAPRHPMGNFLTYDELRYIDERTGVEMSPYWRIHERLAERLLAEVRKPGPAFILVEKAGIHFPYANDVPPNQAYAPKLPRELAPFAKQHADELRRYLIASRYRVDEFFRTTFPELDRDDTLVLYTSDHGQSLFEGGYEGTACSGRNAVPGEGIVPLFWITGDKARQRALQDAARRGFNRAKHSDVIPVLLQAMGYDPTRVEPPYTAGLWQIPPERRRRFFVSSPFLPTVDWIYTE